MSFAPQGQCYPWAVRYAAQWLRAPTSHPIAVVHGWVHHPRGPLAGQTYAHAWIETRGGRAMDWQHREERPMTIAAFYRRYRPLDCVRYTPEQALALAVRHSHYGPWHSENWAHKPCTSPWARRARPR